MSPVLFKELTDFLESFLYEISWSHWAMNLLREVYTKWARADFSQEEGRHHTNEKHEMWFKV